MKKFIFAVLACVLLLGCAMSFTSCFGKDEPAEESKVMNLSLNPEVEFVLDTEDKVVSVNALNEEGNLIISAASFDGKTAEEAATLFVSVSKDLGFVVEANSTIENADLRIAFSGDTEAADKLYASVKGKVDEYLSEANITVNIEKAEALNKAYLEGVVLECYPNMTKEEAEALTYDELVELIKESRRETAEYYSQELKKAYYEAKAFALEQAEFEYLKDQLPALEAMALDASLVLYNGAVSTIESTRTALLVDETGVYQQALKAFREKKTALLNYRAELAAMDDGSVTPEMLARLDEYTAAVTSAEEWLLAKGEEANAKLDAIKDQITVYHEQVVAKIKEASVTANEHLTEISAKQQEAKQAFFAEFEKNYAEHITAAEDDWNGMKNDLNK